VWDTGRTRFVISFEVLDIGLGPRIKLSLLSSGHTSWWCWSPKRPIMSARVTEALKEPS